MAWSGFGLVSIPLVIGTGANIHVLSERIVRVLQQFPPDEGVAIGLSLIMILFVARRVDRRRRSSSAAAATRRSAARASARRRSGSAPGAGRCARAILAYMAVTTILPLFALVIVSLESFWTAHIPWGDLSLRAYRVGIWEEATRARRSLDSIELGLDRRHDRHRRRRARLALRRAQRPRRAACSTARSSSRRRCRTS